MKKTAACSLWQKGQVEQPSREWRTKRFCHTKWRVSVVSCKVVHTLNKRARGWEFPSNTSVWLAKEGLWPTDRTRGDRFYWNMVDEWPDSTAKFRAGSWSDDAWDPALVYNLMNSVDATDKRFEMEVPNIAIVTCLVVALSPKVVLASQLPARCQATPSLVRVSSTTRRRRCTSVWTATVQMAQMAEPRRSRGCAGWMDLLWRLLIASPSPAEN